MAATLSRIASVKAELAKLADEAARAEIHAPIDGYVLRVLEESARYVEEGNPILELGNPSQLEIVVDLLSTDAVKVKPGATVLIEHWGGQEILNAKVRYVEPSAFTKISALGVEEQRVNVIADFVDTSIPLGDGYRVEVRIVIWEGQDVLLIPLSAIFRCNSVNYDSALDAWCTFVVEDGRARKRQVKIRQRSNFEAALEEGVGEGEVVILHPTEQIKDGKRVAPR
ncbi:MAG: HlyD family efflux transporter periplasmic adaptor subunit [Moorea sp. SIO2B7]|nr:HlyD family efflux transporter periplasmic adaptor subunit [Moorena sp. SIO2B7]